MLPVQVKIVSSSSCTLSEASALLQSFLSSGTCSDSFARDYVTSVAQALQDSTSGISGSSGTPSESSSRSSKKPVEVNQSILVAGNSPSHPGKRNLLVAKKLIPCVHGDSHTHGKQILPFAEDLNASMRVMPQAEHGFERHKKERRHSAVEDGFDMVRTSEMEDSALVHRDKKRKKEKHATKPEDGGPEHYGPHNERQHDGKKKKEKLDCPALCNGSFHSKKKRKEERQGKDTEDMETLHVPENRGSPGSLFHTKRRVEVSCMDPNNVRASVMRMSEKVEELAGSPRRKQKEGTGFHPATSVEVLSLAVEREETKIEASPSEFENTASEQKKKTMKKRRRKEELVE